MNLQEVLNTFKISDIILLFVFFIFGIFGIIECINKVKAILEKYRTDKNSVEEKDNEIKNRITALEDNYEQMKSEMNTFKLSLDEIRSIINKVKQSQNYANKATCKSAMMRLSNELIAKNWMSQNECDTLTELTEVYLSSCDKNFTTPNIVRRALNLPVLTEEEIEKIKRDQNISQ